MTGLQWILWLALSLTVISVIWRLLTRYFFIPWPHWLEFWLHNPYMQIFASPDQTMVQMEIHNFDRAEQRSFLEVGCGGGRILIPLMEKFSQHRFVGVDAQTKMIRISNKRMFQAGLDQSENGCFIAGLYQKEMFVADHFDRIAMITVLGEVKHKSQLLEAVACHLKPDGKLTITEVIPDPFWQSKKAVVSLLENNGFNYIKSNSSLMMQTHHFIKKDY